MPKPTEPTRRLTALAPGQGKAMLQGWIDFRFVREVERMEREGRVKSRGALEIGLGMKPGEVNYIREGRRHVSAAEIAQLRLLYNADDRHILYNTEISDERAGAFRGVINLQKYKGFIYEYSRPAGWVVGPQPEAHPGHFPRDPEGKLWVPHPKASQKVQARYEAYKLANPDLPLEQYEREPAEEASSEQNDELRAYLLQPTVAGAPTSGTIWESVRARLSKLPAFLYPAGHKKAGEINRRLYQWMKSGTMRLTPEEVAAAWEGLGQPQKSPDQ